MGLLNDFLGPASSRISQNPPSRGRVCISRAPCLLTSSRRLFPAEGDQRQAVAEEEYGKRSQVTLSVTLKIHLFVAGLAHVHKRTPEFPWSPTPFAVRAGRGVGDAGRAAPSGCAGALARPVSPCSVCRRCRAAYCCGCSSCCD